MERTFTTLKIKWQEPTLCPIPVTGYQMQVLLVVVARVLVAVALFLVWYPFGTAVGYLVHFA